MIGVGEQCVRKQGGAEKIPPFEIPGMENRYLDRVIGMAYNARSVADIAVITGTDENNVLMVLREYRAYRERYRI